MGGGRVLFQDSRIQKQGKRDEREKSGEREDKIGI